MALAVSAPALGAQRQHNHGKQGDALVQIGKPSAPRFFSAEEFRTLSALAERIIPRSDTPGAADVGVPYLIDRAVHDDEALHERYRAGLAELDRLSRRAHQTSFASLGEPLQIALLTPISTAADSEAGRFFQLVKEMTVDAYYSTDEGLRKELGWNANTYLSDFEGCTHPGHQVK